MTNPSTPPCPFCGAAGDPGDRFCQSCGRDLAGPQATGAPPPLPAPLHPPPLPAARTGGLPVWGAVLLVVGGMAILGTAGWLGYRQLAPGPAPTREAVPEAPPPAVVEEPPLSPDDAPQGAESEEPTPSLKSGVPEGEGQRSAGTEADPVAPPVRERPREQRAKPGAAPPTGTACPSTPDPSSAPASPTPTATHPGPAGSPPASDPAPQKPALRPAPPEEPEIVFSKTYECRKTAEFHVDPEEALVTVNGEEIGKADRWDGMFFRKGYAFPGPGTFAVKLSLRGYRTEWVKIVVGPEAKKKTARVELELAKEP